MNNFNFNMDAAYEFINNMTEFGKLINDELKSREDFKCAKHAKLIDSYVNLHRTKYTLKLMFDNFNVSINFEFNGDSYELSFVKRAGRKIASKVDSTYSWAFDWDSIKDGVEAYGLMIKDVRELINNL